jgi:hypothetical protein
MSALRSGIVWISFTSGFDGEVAKAGRLFMNIISKPADPPVKLFNSAVLIGPDGAANRKLTPTKPAISHPQGPQRAQLLHGKRYTPKEKGQRTHYQRTQYQTKAAKFAEIRKRSMFGMIIIRPHQMR